jgi:hypothetical protein
MMDQMNHNDIEGFQNSRNTYRGDIEKKSGLELLTDQDLKTIADECNNIKLSTNAYLFYDLVTAELSSCQIFGQKRSNEECIEGCHFNNYMCGKISNCLSIRTDNSIKNYAAGMAWLTGSSVITPEHLEMILPYTIWHKTKFKPTYIEEFSGENRDDPLLLHIAKKSVAKMKRTFSKTRDEQLHMCKSIQNDELKDAKETLERNDHPVFREYMKM